MTREDFNIGWKVVYGIVAVVDVIIYFQAKEFWLFQLFGFLTFLLFIFLLIDLLILKNWKDIYFFLLILAIVICWIFSFGVELTDNSSKNYILSSISQGLAALFALVFTISLVAAQMSVKYSTRMLRRFFKWYIILYMVLFIFGIIFPLIGMKVSGNWTERIVSISIGLAGTCVILLIPYYLDFKDKLDPEKFLEELADDAIEQINKKNELSEEIKIIDNVIMGAFTEKDYYTFEIGIRKILEMIKMSDQSDIYLELLRRLEKISLVCFQDIRIFEIILENCKEFALNILNDRKGESISHKIDQLAIIIKECGNEAIRRTDDTYVRVSSFYLYQIGDRMLIIDPENRLYSSSIKHIIWLLELLIHDIIKNRNLLKSQKDILIPEILHRIESIWLKLLLSKIAPQNKLLSLNYDNLEEIAVESIREGLNMVIISVITTLGELSFKCNIISRDEYIRSLWRIGAISLQNRQKDNLGQIFLGLEKLKTKLDMGVFIIGAENQFRIAFFKYYLTDELLLNFKKEYEKYLRSKRKQQ